MVWAASSATIENVEFSFQEDLNRYRSQAETLYAINDPGDRDLLRSVDCNGDLNHGHFKFDKIKYFNQSGPCTSSYKGLTIIDTSTDDLTEGIKYMSIEQN
jgi:hypothetical protein